MQWLIKVAQEIKADVAICVGLEMEHIILLWYAIIVIKDLIIMSALYVIKNFNRVNF